MDQILQDTAVGLANGCRKDISRILIDHQADESDELSR
jgi:hypothetical protein